MLGSAPHPGSAATRLSEVSWAPSGLIKTAIGVTVCIDSCVYMCPGPSEAQGVGPTAPRDLPSKPVRPVPPVRAVAPHTPTSPATSAPGRVHGPRPHFRNALLYTVQTHMRVRPGDGASPNALYWLCGQLCPTVVLHQTPTGALTPGVLGRRLPRPSEEV